MLTSFISGGTEYSLEDFYFFEKSLQGIGNYPVFNYLNSAALTAGSDYKGSIGMERVITVAGIIACNDFEQELSLFNDLILLWFKKPVTLILDNGRRIEVFYAGGLEGDLDMQNAGIPIMAKFIAPHPFFYLPPLQETSIPNIPADVSLSNGNAPSFPIIEISGTGGAIESITNLTIDKEIVFDEMMDLIPNEKITIDLNPNSKTIFSSTRGNMFPRLDPSSNINTFNIAPGNNDLQANFSSATVVVKWYLCYGGGN
jgi:hypothetical protein